MKKWLAVYFVSLVIISHVILPVLQSKGFLVFSMWRLFVGGHKPYVFDLTWDQGRTHLFRDYKDQIKQHQINQKTLFYLVQNERLNDVRDLFSSKIHEICQCETVQVVKLQSNLFNYFVLKIPAEKIGQQNL